MNGLPSCIEIRPLTAPLEAEVSVPGSKSITNRALVLAALGSGWATLEGALWSEDTQVMVESLKRLGFRVEVEEDRHETSNRRIRVLGAGGRLPVDDRTRELVELEVGNAGTAARFLAALAAGGRGRYRLAGVPRMHERPQAALFGALRQLGYRVDTETDRLPAVVHGGGRRPGRCEVSIAESSQFASALLLSGSLGGWEVAVVDENEEESSYVAMTRWLIETFPKAGGVFRVEPDASSGSYFWAAGWLANAGSGEGERAVGRVRVRDWPKSGWQIDSRFPGYWPLPRRVSRATDLGDSIMTAVVLGPWAGHEVEFADLGRLRVQECERVEALRTELTRCGGRVREEADSLRVAPGPLHGATVQTYADHRMAMCFAVLGLKVGGVRLMEPGCVRKTFPNFFQKLAAPPPEGLGAEILDGGSGRRLGWEELVAG